MQRAAASSAIPSPQTPDHPSAKRRKLSNASSPATSSADLQAIQAALAADEAKRSEAIDRQAAEAAEAGETKWVLSVRDEGRAVNSHAAGNLRVVTKGYVDIDCARGMEMHSEEPWRPLMVGRRSFGKFNRALEVSLDE